MRAIRACKARHYHVNVCKHGKRVCGGFDSTAFAAATSLASEMKNVRRSWLRRHSVFLPGPGDAASVVPGPSGVGPTDCISRHCADARTADAAAAVQAVAAYAPNIEAALSSAEQAALLLQRAGIPCRHARVAGKQICVLEREAAGVQCCLRGCPRFAARPRSARWQPAPPPAISAQASFASIVPARLGARVAAPQARDPSPSK